MSDPVYDPKSDLDAARLDGTILDGHVPHDKVRAAARALVMGNVSPRPGEHIVASLFGSVVVIATCAAVKKADGSDPYVEVVGDYLLHPDLLDHGPVLARGLRDAADKVEKHVAERLALKKGTAS